jgi:hypothetical protein
MTREASCSFTFTFNWVLRLVSTIRQNGMLRFHDIKTLLADSEDMQPRKLW